jgi:hypothetical protein
MFTLGQNGIRVELTRPSDAHILLALTTMDGQPSTSSDALDQRRQDTLKSYREVCLLLFDIPSRFNPASNLENAES